MITVEGGFAKAVNVKSEIEGCFIKTTVWMRMTYADNEAREALVKRLHEEGYRFSSGNNDDARFRIVLVPLFGFVADGVE